MGVEILPWLLLLAGGGPGVRGASGAATPLAAGGGRGSEGALPAAYPRLACCGAEGKTKQPEDIVQSSAQVLGHNGGDCWTLSGGGQRGGPAAPRL